MTAMTCMCPRPGAYVKRFGGESHVCGSERLRGGRMRAFETGLSGLCSRSVWPGPRLRSNLRNQD